MLQSIVLFGVRYTEKQLTFMFERGYQYLASPGWKPIYACRTFGETRQYVLMHNGRLAEGQGLASIPLTLQRRFGWTQEQIETAQPQPTTLSKLPYNI